MKYLPAWLTASLSALLLLSASPSSAAQAEAQLADDAIDLPPVHQVVTSPNQLFLLVLQSPDGWATPQPTAALYSLDDRQCQRLWQRSLPQSYGPRFALVSNSGTTLLLDEWINVASDYAVFLLDPAGQLIAQHSFDQVAAMLPLSRAEIVERSRFGWWIAATPVLLTDGQQAQVDTAGQHLLIDLDNGQLRL